MAHLLLIPYPIPATLSMILPISSDLILMISPMRKIWLLSLFFRWEFHKAQVGYMDMYLVGGRAEIQIPGLWKLYFKPNVSQFHSC